MESTSKRGHIQLSKDTAELLVAAGKSDWIKPRESLVNAKGKGELETFWLRATVARKDDATSVASGSQVDEEPEYIKMGKGSEDKLERLISWNTESLLGLLRQILAHQHQSCVTPANGYTTPVGISDQGRTPLDEVKEIIQLPEFNHMSSFGLDPAKVEVGENVELELRDYVACIASMYRDNPFHNFEHASHVLMSVSDRGGMKSRCSGLTLSCDANGKGDQIVDPNRGPNSS